jgi:hypothetical protein
MPQQTQKWPLASPETSERLCQTGSRWRHSVPEMVERLNVSPRLVRCLAAQGRIYPAKKTRGGWLLYANSTVIRPFERAGRKPNKMTLPHDELSVGEFLRHSCYRLDNT